MDGSRELVHIMVKSGFTGFIDFFNENFDQEKTAFILYGSDDVPGYKKPNASNVLIVERYYEVFTNKEARHLLSKTKLIILNWVDPRLAGMLMPYRKKLMLCFWGGDLYSCVESKEEHRGGIRQKIINFLVATAIRNAEGVITLTSEERTGLEKLGFTGMSHYVCPIASGLKKNVGGGTAKLKQSRVVNGTIRILLGNSATQTNRHIPAMEVLSKYAKEDVEFIVPLSYGSVSYREEVLEAGKRILGQGFKPLLHYMNREDYVSLLSTISVGVFNHNRQQGIGNIAILLQQGAKVYLPKDGPVWRHYSDMGAVLGDIYNIKNECFDDFLFLSDSAKKTNMELLSRRAIAERGVARWKKVVPRNLWLACDSDDPEL